MNPIRFDVVGTPVTQGSKTAFMAGGRSHLRETGGAKHKDWRYAVADEARRWQERSLTPGLIEGPILVQLSFRLTKPASAPKTRRTWPIKARSGDVDKLARSILDSLTGTLFGDDSQVVGLIVTKDWGDPPGVDVQVRPVPAEAVTIDGRWVSRLTELGEQVCTSA